MKNKKYNKYIVTDHHASQTGHAATQLQDVLALEDVKVAQTVISQHLLWRPDACGANFTLPSIVLGKLAQENTLFP